MRFRKLKQQSKQTTKELLTDTVNYARYTERIKAFITDLFMIYIPILYIITYIALDGKDDFQSSQIAQFVGVFLYGFIYAFLLSKFAQTPGKKAYDIQVVDATSFKNISFLRAYLRFIAFLISATTLLGLLLPFYRKDKRALHDLIAQTSVIKVENNK